jgi:hypothetical protein
MYSSSREEIVVAFDALEADLDRALELSFDALTTPERLVMLARCEVFRRRLPALEHPLINQISAQATATELGGKLPSALADRLRITRAEASRRIGEAAELGDRKAITGEPWPPLLTATAAAQRDGRIGSAHVAVIRGFVHHLARTGGQGRQGNHRRGSPAADERRDPAGLPCPSLLVHLRQRQSDRALPHQAPGLSRSADRVVRQGPRVFAPRL